MSFKSFSADQSNPSKVVKSATYAAVPPAAIKAAAPKKDAPAAKPAEPKK